MKFNKIFLAILVLIVVSGIGVAVAAEASVGDHTFTIPDGYKLLNSTDDTAILQEGNTHAIVVMMSDEVKSIDDARKNLESKGYEFLGENTYDAEGYSVTQQNFEKDGLTVYSYNFQMKDGKYCVITYTIPSSEQPGENEDNPITEIIKTLK